MNTKISETKYFDKAINVFILISFLKLFIFIITIIFFCVNLE